MVIIIFKMEDNFFKMEKYLQIKKYYFKMLDNFNKMEKYLKIKKYLKIEKYFF